VKQAKYTEISLNISNALPSLLVEQKTGNPNILKYPKYFHHSPNGRWGKAVYLRLFVCLSAGYFVALLCLTM